MFKSMNFPPIIFDFNFLFPRSREDHLIKMIKRLVSKVVNGKLAIGLEKDESVKIYSDLSRHDKRCKRNNKL